jgi:hypothetical protein
VKNPILAVTLLGASVVGAAVIVYATWSSESAPGASAVYVVSATTGDVVEIDPGTLEAETIALGHADLQSIAVAGEYLYYASSSTSSRSGVGRYNLVTGENERTYIAEDFYAPALRTSPTEPDALFVGEQYLSPGNIQKWIVPEDDQAPRLLVRTEHTLLGSDLRDFEVSADGTRVWTTRGSPYEFLELRAADLRATGRTFPAIPYPESVDAVSVGDREYLVGGISTDDQSIHLYEVTDPAAEPARFGGGSSDMFGSVALSPDATTVYRTLRARNDLSGSIQVFSAATGDMLVANPLRLSDSFLEGIQTDPASGRVFVSLENEVGVLDPDGTLIETVPVAGAGQIVIGSS